MKNFKRVAGVVLASLILMGAVYFPVNAAARAAYVQCPECGADAAYWKEDRTVIERVPCEHGLAGEDEITTKYRVTVTECTDISCGYYEEDIHLISEEVICLEAK